MSANPTAPPAYPLKRQWDITFSGSVSPSGKTKSPAPASSKIIKPPRLLGGFECVKSMWQLMNNLPPLGRIPIDATIYCFQRGIDPAWEHPANTDGGRWMYSIPAADEDLAATAWRNLYLDLVGEGLDPTSEVVGIVCARRRNYTRFSVWTKNKSRGAAIMAIGQLIKADLPPTVALEYQAHGSDYGAYKFVL